MKTFEESFDGQSIQHILFGEPGTAAVRTPYFIQSSAAVEWASVEITILQPFSFAFKQLQPYLGGGLV